MHARLLFHIAALTVASAGFTASAANVNPVTYGSAWQYMIGTQEVSAPVYLWRTNTYEDAAWLTGAAPIGRPSNPPNNPNGWGSQTLIPEATPSLFCRLTFPVADPLLYAQLSLAVRIQDGFIAWLNGVEVGRRNVGAVQPAYNTRAQSGIAPTEFTLPINTPANALRAGANVLAVQVFSRNPTNNAGLFFDATLNGFVDDTPVVVRDLDPYPGDTVTNLTEIDVTFNKSVTGAQPGDLLINGNPATSVQVLGPAVLGFQFPQPPTGAVEVTWSALNNIHDTTPLANGLLTNAWSYTLDPNAIYANLLVNELMAVNSGSVHATNSIRDEDGDSSDWIEIYNSGDFSVNLAGCYLTDDTNNLARWQFPGVLLGAGKSLIVFASGKNRTDPTRPLHTDFALDSAGGYVALVDPHTNVISDLSYPAQTKDVSYGRLPGTPDTLGFFPIPTPGAANLTGGPGFGPQVQFSRSSGTFTTPFTVTLTAGPNPSTNPVVIRYNLGTNAPGTNSPIYTSPIGVSNTVWIRARAFVAGLLPGELHSEAFIRLDSAHTNIMKFNTPLPIFVLHNYGQGSVPDATPQSMMLQVFEPQLGFSSLTNPPDLAVRAFFHKRGQATLGLPKANLRVTTVDEYNADKNVVLAGMPKDNDWVLYAINGYDKVLMHNPMGHGLYRQMGHYTSRTRYVELFLKDDSGTPGPITYADYNGLYVLEEKIKIGKNRVDIDALAPENTNAPSVTGGYLLDYDKLKGGDPLMGSGTMAGLPTGSMGLLLLEPDYFTAPKPQILYISNYLNAFYAALTSTRWTNPVTGYLPYMDRPSWIDFHLHQTVMFNIDMISISSYFHKPRNGPLVQGPLWDFDRAFGTFGNGDVRGLNPFQWRSPDNGNSSDVFGNSSDGYWVNPWYGRLFKDPDFFQKWIDRYQELRQSIYSSSNVTAVIDQFANEINEATGREYARWANQDGSDTTPNSGSCSADGWTYTFPTPGTWAGQVQFIKTWFTNRFLFMDTNFLDPPSLSRPGGLMNQGDIVTLSPAAKSGSSVIYTLDGTDPRLLGGAISSAVLSNNGPVTLTITNNVRVFARSRNPNHKNLTGAGNPSLSSPWSGVTEATYYVEVPALRVTEIMYHPPSPPAGDTNSAEDFEYLEVKNTGAAPLDLYRCRLRGGVQFDFPRLTLAGGQSCVAVASTNAFARRYGTNVPGVLVAGQYTNNLGNGGDRIILEGPMREPILDFSYSDQWYPTTDGQGFALVIVNENAPTESWGLKESWRAGSELWGSPGRGNLPPLGLAPVLINEALTSDQPPACDAVELYNPASSPANISGWFLTDNFKKPTKYRIPEGTTIDPGGYRVFYATNSFGPSFGFSAQGEEVYLFSGDGTNLTGYGHGFAFGAQFNGVSFGRYVSSQGNEEFVAQVRPTLGGLNAGPAVGPVVISEIMYHPPDPQHNGLSVDNTFDEYIELQNVSNEDVPLYDPAFPANTWQLQNALNFVFPPDTVIPAGGFFLVVNFDPAAPGRASAFRNRYGISAAVPLFGPGGALPNDDGRIELVRPSAPANGSVPYVLVEGITYSGGPPWPLAANGFGASLQRVSASGYGNDPTNWVSTAPNPGTPYGGGALPTIAQQPTDLTVISSRNLSAVFTVAPGGPGPFKYQWLYNGMTIFNATNASLTVTNVMPPMAGTYQAIVFNPAGSIASRQASLTVLTPISITRQPVGASVKSGTNITFTVVASSARPIRFQWLFNGLEISGATNSAYVIANVDLLHDGNYAVRVSDAVSSELSQPARLYVLVDPMPLVGPQSQIVPVDAPVDLSVQVTPTATLPVYYRLRRNSLPLADFLLNQRAMTFTFTNIVLTNSGGYCFLVTNQSRRVLTLSPTGLVSVVQPPADVMLSAPGTNVAFTAVVGNPGSINYPAQMSFDWQFNGVSLSNAHRGASCSNVVLTITNGTTLLTTNTLLLSDVQASDFGTYALQITIITNPPVDPALFSAVLNLDSDGDGLPDDWELAYGFDPHNPSDALQDADGDGMSNLAEYQAGTNPRDSQSYLKVQSVVANGMTNVVLSFDAISNHNYSLLRTDKLKLPATWNILAIIPGAPTNRTVTVIDFSPNAVLRYYRLRTPWQP